MECPSCGLMSTRSAERCSCGWDFSRATHDDSRRARAARRDRSIMRGGATIVVALVVGGSAWLAFDAYEHAQLQSAAGVLSGNPFGGHSTSEGAGASYTMPTLLVLAAI